MWKIITRCQWASRLKIIELGYSVFGIVSTIFEIHESYVFVFMKTKSRLKGGERLGAISYFNEHLDFGDWRLISIRLCSVLILLNIAFDVAWYCIARICISVNSVGKSIHFALWYFWKCSLEIYHFLFVESKHLARANLWNQT